MDFSGLTLRISVIKGIELKVHLMEDPLVTILANINRVGSRVAHLLGYLAFLSFWH